MSDLISRQDAIEAVYNALRTPLPDYKKDLFHDSMSLAVSIVKSIPSAEPKRKKGKWLPHPSYREWDVCSVCGTGCKRREYEIQYGHEKVTEYVYLYCPHCGARLE